MNSKVQKEAIRNPHVPILFVDDDPLAHELIKKYLRDWDIQFAYSAEDALSILNRENILIVMTDIMMPGMDGITLLREIKKTRGLIQVIIVSASEELEDLMNALEVGANDFILKPLKKKDIEGALENSMAKITRWKTTMKTLFQKRRKTTNGN
ncbi:MAG: response regulator [Thermodesulfobacteriota bacterium]|nr:response regulator [Thermodesulfobacteriota bacterium]